METKLLATKRIAFVSCQHSLPNVHKNCKNNCILLSFIAVRANEAPTQSIFGFHFWQFGVKKVLEKVGKGGEGIVLCLTRD